MEKLQPVLKQIFWICFGFALLFLLIGWWSAKGDLTTQIDTRRSAVDKAFSDAKENVGAVPNARWTEGAAKKNEKHQADFNTSATSLYEDQLKARVYPRSIRDELNTLKFNSEIKKKALRERFAQLYPSYFREQLKVIKPFENGEGLVDISNLKITQEDYSRWRTQRPRSTEIWHAQEDIWLIRSILDSIASVNGSADRIDKAPLRAMSLLWLRGGDRDTEPGGGGAAGGGMGFGGDSGEGMPEMMGGGGFGSPGVGMGAASGAWSAYDGSLTADLLTEEFGPDANAAAGGFGGMGMPGGSMDMDGDFGGAAAAEEEDDGSSRYVDENPRYRTRAFTLTVKIVQTEIPTLLAELTNSSFPVEIVRVDASFGSGPSMSGGAGMMGGGYGSGDGGYGGEGMGASPEPGGGGFGGGGFGGGAAFGGGGFGSGMGMGSPGMGSPGMGSPGMGSPGMGSPGMGSPGMGGPGRPGANADPVDPQKLAMGQRLLAMAMADPSLATVRVAGLMTLYRNEAENEAEAEAESAAEAEAKDGGADMSGVEEMVPDTGLETVDPQAAPNETGNPTNSAEPDAAPADAAPANADGTGSNEESPGTVPADPASQEGVPAAGGNPAAADGGSPLMTPGDEPKSDNTQQPVGTDPLPSE